MNRNYTLRLDEDLIVAIKIYAAKNRVSASSIIESAIRVWLKGKDHADKTGTAKAHACAVAGKAVHTQAQDYTATVPAMRQTGGTTSSS